MPHKEGQSHLELHYRKSTLTLLTRRAYERPTQFRRPTENGSQAALLQVSTPLSDSIHRSGMKEFGLEKFRSSCIIVQNDVLTIVFH